MRDSLPITPAPEAIEPQASPQAAEPQASAPAANKAPAAKPRTITIPAAREPESPDTAAEAADTIAAFNPATAHIAMDPPCSEHPRGHEVQTAANPFSWIVLALLTIFLLIAMRFQGNLRFTGSMLKELTAGPEKKNMFDDTMRESTFIGLLNMLTIGSSGLLLWLWARPTPLLNPRALLLCAALAAALYICQRIAYFCIGRIFATPRLTTRWLSAFSASQGLLSALLFPLALISLFYPAGVHILLIPALIAWILARLMFVIKGYRIFSTCGGTYLTFLYYLCSVEIIPPIMCCAAAAHFCRSL